MWLWQWTQHVSLNSRADRVFFARSARAGGKVVRPLTGSRNDYALHQVHINWVLGWLSAAVTPSVAASAGRDSDDR